MAWNPLAVLLEVATGKRVWPTAATVILAAATIAVVGVVTLVVVSSRGRRRGARHPIDVQARLLTPPRKLRGVTARDADRVGTRVFPPDPRDPDDAAGRAPGWRRGLRLGNAVAGNMAVFLPWQSVVAMVGGTGSGKTAGGGGAGGAGRTGCGGRHQQRTRPVCRHVRRPRRAGPGVVVRPAGRDRAGAHRVLGGPADPSPRRGRGGEEARGVLRRREHRTRMPASTPTSTAARRTCSRCICSPPRSRVGTCCTPRNGWARTGRDPDPAARRARGTVRRQADPGGAADHRAPTRRSLRHGAPVPRRGHRDPLPDGWWCRRRANASRSAGTVDARDRRRHRRRHRRRRPTPR